jgi:hypothetical protein
MSTLSQVVTPTTTRSNMLQACAVIATAAVAGLAGLSWLTSLSASAQVPSTSAQPWTQRLTMPAAPASPYVTLGTTVPAASTVFAGRDAVVVEEQAPPF